MSVEGAKRLAIDAIALGATDAIALARRVLEELETPGERSRRQARERQSRRRSERDISVTAPSRDAVVGQAARPHLDDDSHAAVTRIDTVNTGKAAPEAQTRHAAVTLRGVGGSPSLDLGSRDLSKDPERETRAKRDISVTGDSVTTVPLGTRGALPADFVLTPMRKTAAEIGGCTDVADVFRKFQLMAIEKEWLNTPAGWEARWERFWREGLKYQREDRERRRESETRLRKGATHIQPAAAVRGWKVGDGQ